MEGKQPPMEVLKKEISEDGRSATIELESPPYGVYDPEKQLSPEQVIELKSRFKEDSGILAAEVCAKIALPTVKDTPFDKGKERDQFAKSVGFAAAHWMWCLEQALDLPEAEWPDYISPPATFSEALNEVLEEYEERQKLNG